MIPRKKIKKRNIISLTILSICIIQTIYLPILLEGQKNNEEIQITTEEIYDFVPKTVILQKKGIFYEMGDIHRFYVKIKEDVEYVARIKVTAQGGGTYLIRIWGGATGTSNTALYSGAVTKQSLEITHTGDVTTTGGYVEIIYTPNVLVERPEYTLYFNKQGFAGWWWIALSGIGSLTVLVILLTFAIMGMISVSKRKKKKEKKKKRK